MIARLQKVIAAAGICSRREAERLIAEGEVSVNGRTVTEQGLRVDPSVDRITVLGRRVRASRPPLTLAVHKPRGVVTTAKDPEGRETVTDLVAGVGERLFPIGRLDYNAEGLILLTNDGELAYWLMRPGGVPKTYRVKVKGHPAPEAIERLRHGLKLDGRPLLPTRVVVESRGETSWLRVTLHEGRKNQIVRMMEAVGHPVRRLRRVSIGPVQLGSLPPRRWRPLESGEIEALRRAAGISPRPHRVGSKSSASRDRTDRQGPPARDGAGGRGGRRQTPRRSAAPRAGAADGSWPSREPRVHRPRSS